MSGKPWEENFEPLKIFGNLYFVGTPPASVHTPFGVLKILKK